MELFPHQQKVVDQNKPKLLLAHSTGTGKTLTALSLVNKNKDSIRSVMIVVPKILREKWQRECISLLDGKVSVYVCTKEEFRRDAVVLKRFDAVIIDEGHYFAGHQSKMFKSMLYYLNKHAIQYVWIATATPYLSTPNNIWALGVLLGKEWKWWSFQKEFFTEVNMGGRRVPVVRKGIEDKLAALVQEMGSVVDMGEVVEVPEQVFETEYLSLTEEQEKAILELEESTFIAYWTKKHQVENGVLYVQGYEEDGLYNSETKVYESAKLARVIELAQDNLKLALFFRYNGQLKHFENELKKKYPTRTILSIHSDVKDRDGILREAEESDECIILIQAACSAGYELPSIPLIVFVSLSFSYVDYTQACGRFLRINKLKSNRYIHLVVKDGVDEDVYKSVMKKEDFHFTIYGIKE